MTFGERMTVRGWWVVKWVFGIASVILLVCSVLGLVLLVFTSMGQRAWFFGFWPLALAISKLPVGPLIAQWLFVFLMGALAWVAHWIDEEALYQINDYYDT